MVINLLKYLSLQQTTALDRRSVGLYILHHEPPLNALELDLRIWRFLWLNIKF